MPDGVLTALITMLGATLTGVVMWFLGSKKRQVEVNLNVAQTADALADASSKNVESAQALLVNLTEDLKATKAALEKVKASNEMLTSTVAAAQADMAQLRAENAELRGENERLSQEMAQLRTLLADAIDRAAGTPGAEFLHALKRALQIGPADGSSSDAG